MKSIRSLLYAALGAALLAGCATAFTGSAYVDGGAAGCRAKCTEWDLEFGGMVAMGEYSDACLCVPREKAKKPDAVRSAASAAGSAVGVVLQTRESERRNRHF